MAKPKVLKKTHPISELEARMNPAVLAKAKKMAEEENLNIRLAILREKFPFSKPLNLCLPKSS